MLRSLFTAFIAIAISGAAAAQQTPTTATPVFPAAAAQAGEHQLPPSPLQKMTPEEAMQRSGGSLLRATIGAAPDPNQAKLENVSWFSVPPQQPHTLKKHDLVTIIVNEASEYKSDATTDLKKEQDLDAKINAMIKVKLSNYAIYPGGSGAPEISLSNSRDFKGEASLDRTDSLTIRVTAEVVDVKPNGTLVLQARQRIKHDEEEQEFVLSGTCRAEDVTPDNTVLSTQVFDKDLVTNHKGAVRDTTKRGWLGKLLDAANPF